MNSKNEPSNLLQEAVILSEQERQQILSEIERDFLDSSEDDFDINRLAAKSSGVVLPLFIAMFVIAATALLMLTSTIMITRENKINLEYKFTNISGSEWKILQLYMKETTRRIERKNNQINIYKKEIENYDHKLKTLKELLKIKQNTENRLAQERARLVSEGLTEGEITVKINALKKDFVSDIAPDMSEFYSLSIAEINKQIDELLNAKSKSEENLKTSVAEQEQLVIKTNGIQEQIKVQETAAPELLASMNRLKQIVDHYKNEEKVQSKITDLYGQIFRAMDTKDSIQALQKIDDLQQILKDIKDQKVTLRTDQIPVNEKIVRTLKTYINKAEEEDAVKTAADISAERDHIHRSQEGMSTDGLLLFGVVSFSQFNTVFIDSLSGMSISKGSTFYIFKRGHTDIALGRGTISGVSSAEIVGELKTSFNTEYTIEADDLVYITP